MAALPSAADLFHMKHTPTHIPPALTAEERRASAERGLARAKERRQAALVPTATGPLGTTDASDSVIKTKYLKYKTKYLKLRNYYNLI
jgi:hypothetical protein